jgi:hypothetical protein
MSPKRIVGLAMIAAGAMDVVVGFLVVRRVQEQRSKQILGLAIGLSALSLLVYGCALLVQDGA